MSDEMREARATVNGDDTPTTADYDRVLDERGTPGRDDRSAARRHGQRDDARDDETETQPHGGGTSATRSQEHDVVDPQMCIRGPDKARLEDEQNRLTNHAQAPRHEQRDGEEHGHEQTQPPRAVPHQREAADQRDHHGDDPGDRRERRDDRQEEARAEGATPCTGAPAHTHQARRRAHQPWQEDDTDGGTDPATRQRAGDHRERRVGRGSPHPEPGRTDQTAEGEIGGQSGQRDQAEEDDVHGGRRGSAQQCGEQSQRHQPGRGIR